MKKLLITLIATTAFAVPFLYMHAPEETVYGPDSHRGCVASAYQATANGSASDLEANLSVCDQLLVAD